MIALPKNGDDCVENNAYDILGFMIFFILKCFHFVFTYLVF